MYPHHSTIHEYLKILIKSNEILKNHKPNIFLISLYTHTLKHCVRTKNDIAFERNKASPKTAPFGEKRRKEKKRKEKKKKRKLGNFATKRRRTVYRIVVRGAIS